MRRLTTLLLSATVLAVAPSARAQSLAARIGEVSDGTVLFQFPARPGICGNGEGTVRVGRSMYMNYNGRMHEDVCEPGPVRVRAELRGGEVQRIDSWVGPLRTRTGRDLGQVDAVEGARWLLGIAAGARKSAAEDAIAPAMFAAATPDWRALIAIARDRARPEAVRTNASFWLSRLASATLAGHPGDLAIENDDDEVTEEKKHAVFVLSQLPRDRSVPALVDVARNNSSPSVRGQALFWLGQSGDQRALELFQQILSK